MDFEQAMQYAEDKHKGQYRQGGLEYVTHPIEVANMIREKGLTDEMVMTALFHDLLEDTDATEADILALSNDVVLDAVKRLTKVEGYQMDAYIQGIRDNEIAKLVKLADRIHNLRHCNVTSEAFKKRYLEETETYFVDLARDTIFEKELMEALEALRMMVKG